MGQCRLLLVSVCNVILLLTIALESQMWSLFLIHGLHAQCVARSTHSLLEMSQKEVWAKESRPTCSSPHGVPENSAQCLPCSRPRHIFVSCPGACSVSHCSKSVMTLVSPDRVCSLPITRKLQLYPFSSMEAQIALPFLHVSALTEGCVCLSCSPAQSLSWLQDVQSKVHWAEWVKAAHPVLSPCIQHATVIRLPLLPSCVQRISGADLGACTEQGGFWARNMLGRTCTMHVKWHLKWPWL